MTVHPSEVLFELHAMHMNCQVTKAESKIKLIEVLGYDIVWHQFFSQETILSMANTHSCPIWKSKT